MNLIPDSTSRLVLLSGICALVAAAVIVLRAPAPVAVTKVEPVVPALEAITLQSRDIADLQSRVESLDRRLRTQPRNRQVADELARTMEDLAERLGEDNTEAIELLERAEALLVVHNRIERDWLPVAGSDAGFRTVGRVVYSIIAEGSAEECMLDDEAALQAQAQARAFTGAVNVITADFRSTTSTRFRQQWPGSERVLGETSDTALRDGVPCTVATSTLEVTPPVGYRTPRQVRWKPLSVRVETNTTDYRPGDQVWLYVETNRAISVRLLLTTPAGVTTSLLEEDVLLTAGSHTFPRADDTWSFVSASPHGAGEITFLASPSVLGPINVDPRSPPDVFALETRLALEHAYFGHQVETSEFVGSRVVLMPSEFRNASIGSPNR